MRPGMLAPLAAAMLALTGCASAPPVADRAQVTGAVTYRERILLAPPGMVTVTLADTSLADAPARVIATQVIEGATAPPFNFSLDYDPAQIIPNHTYTVSARIEVDGRLRFINDTQVPVITRGAPTHVEIVAVAVPQR
ncbi:MULTISPECIES: YbaY family lipoprotein [Phenylobacterium]|uniref:Lipoprotein n=1 Tax=Phenylobacterium koreense TaxID=266125 RepID=A0ABV2EHS3_9CAUL